jgi:putative membrane protein
LGALAFMLLDARSRLLTLVAMALSAITGLSALSSPSLIMPVLAGFFGVSTILFSLKTRASIPAQKPPGSVGFRPRPAVVSAFFALVSSFLPGVSASVSGAMAKTYARLGLEDFLVALGGINSVYAFMAVLAVFIVGRPRSGAGIIVESLSPSALEVVGCVLLALGLSAFLAWHSGSFVARGFSALGSRKLNAFALLLTIALALVFAGPRGLLALATASCIGYFCLVTGTRRMSCMASLIFPTIVFYLL